MTPQFRKRIKTALGIPLDDTTRDAWIAERGDGILAMMRTRTGAALYPLRRFRDVFHGTRFTRECNEGLTPMHHPIATVEDISINGMPVDVVADYPVTTDGRISFYRTPAAIYSEVSITYQAGFAELPADLFEVLAEILQALIDSIESGSNPFSTPTKISLVDVGSVEFKNADSFSDLLGPFGATLDAYSNLAMVGGPLVVESIDLGEVPPTP